MIEPSDPLENRGEWSRQWGPLYNSLVVLAGPNGSGKTAVMEAALIAVGGATLAVGPNGKRAIRRGASDYLIQTEVRTRTSIRDEDPPFHISSRSTPSKIQLGLPIWYFSSWRAPNLVGSVDVTVGKRGPRPKSTDSNRLLYVKQQLANAAAARSFPAAKASLLGNYEDWIRRINAAWEIFYPDQNDHFSVDLADPDDDGRGSFEVFLKRSEAPSLAVDNLSAGQLELFLFLAVLILNDRGPGIVFIDEPELHLDPQWHAPILRALMRIQPTAQFIVATHSPTIYDSAMSFERHFLAPADDPRVAIWGQESVRR